MAFIYRRCPHRTYKPRSNPTLQSLVLVTLSTARTQVAYLLNTIKQSRISIMGLPVAYEEDFNFPYQTYGVPCERDLVQNRLSKLRIEVFDATTSHLPELIHLPYFEIDPSAARTLPELLVYLQRQVASSSDAISSSILRGSEYLMRCCYRSPMSSFPAQR
jgi:hypothetical protein